MLETLLKGKAKTKNVISSRKWVENGNGNPQQATKECRNACCQKGFSIHWHAAFRLQAEPFQLWKCYQKKREKKHNRFEHSELPMDYPNVTQCSIFTCLLRVGQWLLSTLAYKTAIYFKTKWLVSVFELNPSDYEAKQNWSYTVYTQVDKGAISSLT